MIRTMRINEILRAVAIMEFTDLCDHRIHRVVGILRTMVIMELWTFWNYRILEIMIQLNSWIYGNMEL